MNEPFKGTRVPSLYRSTDFCIVVASWLQTWLLEAIQVIQFIYKNHLEIFVIGLLLTYLHVARLASNSSGKNLSFQMNRFGGYVHID